jgi:fatty-acyl-CoA synthase
MPHEPNPADSRQDAPWPPRPPFRDVTVGNLLTLLARAFPTRPALLYDNGPRYTFAELEAEARLVARGLIAHDVRPGERVVVWATNVPEWIVLQFALAKIGAILVTANTSLRARDIDYLLRQSEAATIVTIGGFRGLDYVAALDEIGVNRGAIPGLERRFFIGRAGEAVPPGFTPFDALRRDAARVEDLLLDARSAAVGVDDVINMQYTSGTTGFPKGVMLSSRNIVNNGEVLGRMLGYTPEDRLCLCVPLFHCFGCVIGVLGAYTHGASICPLEWFEPARVLATIARERCTALYGVPTMFLAEVEHPDFARFDLTSLRTGIMAGALCPEPLMRRVMSEMHLAEITIAYGLTEASPAITMTPRDATVADRSQTVGVVLPELEVRIVDPATRAERAVGERGELCVRGYNVMRGYYNNPDATRAAVDADGWLYTGDEASIDAAGLVRITGRIKDLIIRGGENISPKEVEDCLREHPAVADAYVYGVPDDFFGEVVAASVRLRPRGDDVMPDASGPSVSDEALIRWCSERLARFKVPSYVRFVSEFPMTASGKIQKFKLRDSHVAERGDAPATPADPPRAATSSANAR